MIESLKDLDRLLKLCRKQGVTEISLQGVSVKLGDAPVRQAAGVMQDVEETETEDPYADFPDGPLTPEELTFFANGGKPEDNPYRRDQ